MTSACAEPRSEWTEPGLAENVGIKNEMASAFPGTCEDYGAADFAKFKHSQKIIDSSVVPTAQGTCTAFEETLEISTFASDSDRDRFIKDRAEAICEKSKEQNIGLPGLRWTIGDRFSIQPDTQAVAMMIAEAVGGEYLGTPCDEAVVFDWDPAGIESIRIVAEKLEAAGHGCSRFALDDRDALLTSKSFKAIGFPAVMATCSAAEGDASPTIRLIGFVPEGLDSETYLGTFFDRSCGEMHAGAFAIGADVVAMAPAADVEAIADAIGSERTEVCPA